MWKAELVSNEYGYLTQKIFKMLKILLTDSTYSKMGEKEN